MSGTYKTPDGSEWPNSRVVEVGTSKYVLQQEIMHLQTLLGVQPDGLIGPKTRRAAAGAEGKAEACKATGWNEAIEAIVPVVRGMLVEDDGGQIEVPGLYKLVDSIVAAIRSLARPAPKGEDGK